MLYVSSQFCQFYSILSTNRTNCIAEKIEPQKGTEKQNIILWVEKPFMPQNQQNGHNCTKYSQF